MAYPTGSGSDGGTTTVVSNPPNPPTINTVSNTTTDVKTTEFQTSTPQSSTSTNLSQPVTVEVGGPIATPNLVPTALPAEPPLPSPYGRAAEPIDPVTAGLQAERDDAAAVDAAPTTAPAAVDTEEDPFEQARLEAERQLEQEAPTVNPEDVPVM